MPYTKGVVLVENQPLGLLSKDPQRGADLIRPKPTAANLATSEIRYRRLFESARDGILILNSVTLRSWMQIRL